MQSLTLEQYYQSKGMPGGYGELDHGILSPNGTPNPTAKRRILDAHSAKTDAMREYFALIDSGEIVDPSGKYPSPDFRARAEKNAGYKTQQAAELERLADGGMRPRAYRKRAAELCQQAAELLAPYQVKP